MKSLQFFAQIFILCFVLLETVSGTPQKYKAADGREYLIETELKYNWHQAFHECARRDSQLVIIDSAAKNQAIVDLLQKVVGKPHNLWLGGNDEYSTSPKYERPFYWSATGQKFNFTYWSENNPDNYKLQEHCVHTWASKPAYKWNDNECTNKFGFICEVNHYYEKYQNDLKNKCAAVKQTTTSITQEFTKTQQEQLSEINLKLQAIDILEEKFKIEFQQWQNITHASIQKVIEEQQTHIKQLSEKMLKQVSVLSVELKKSTSEISSQFAEKLNVKQNEINKSC